MMNRQNNIRILVVVACVLSSAPSAMADYPVITSRGIGARALGMGNSFVSLADDFSAVYWNPAGLGFVPIREIAVGLEGVKNTGETEFGGTSDDGSNQRLVIDHVGLVRSIPVSSGGFAFAVGFSSPCRLDNAFRFSGTDTHIGSGRVGYYYDPAGEPIPDTLHRGDKLYYEKSDVRGYGALNFINFAVGWQIAPSLGLGIAVSPIVGRENASISVISYKAGQLLFENSLQEFRRRYGGIDARMGVLYAPAGIVRAGLRLQAPQYIRMYQRYTYTDRTYGELLERGDNEATLITSVSGAAGASVKLPFMVVSAEGDFRSPFPQAEGEDELSYWRVGFSGGLEVPVPRVPVVFRAGYSWHEPDFMPYDLEWDDAALDALGDIDGTTIHHTTDVHTITGGVALLVKNYMSVQAAYGYSFWEYSAIDPEWANSVDEKHSSHRLLVSFSFRY